MIAPSNRSASRSSRLDQNHLYHDQMVLRGKRPPFLDIIADGDAETMTFVVLLGPGTRAMEEGQRVGRIAVFANAAPPSQAVEITRAGFGTTVSAPSIAPPPPN